MLVTVFGIVTDVIFDPPDNALFGIAVVPSANMTEAVQSWKANHPMLVTEFGIVIDVSPVHP